MRMALNSMADLIGRNLPKGSFGLTLGTEHGGKGVIKMLNRVLPSVVLAALAVSAAQAQVTMDVSKITCEQYILFKVADPQHIAIWLSGYYNGKRNNMVVDVGQLKANAEKLMRYCETNIKGTVVEAVEKLFAPEK